MRRGYQGVAGVSAVPGHRQLVLTSLVADGERRVFGRVPQTGSTLDLRTHACIRFGFATAKDAIYPHS